MAPIYTDNFFLCSHQCPSEISVVSESSQEMPDQSYSIEGSEDLSEWSEVTSFENSSGQEVVQDTVDSDSGAAFYRARKQQ